MRTLIHSCAFVAALASAGGCKLFSDRDSSNGRSPLRPARSSPDSITMEIVWARFAHGDPQINHAAWQEIDETQLDPATRRALAENGFRAGVVSGTPPPAVARALGMDQADAASAVRPGEPQSLDLLAEPTVRGQVKQLRRNQRMEVQASDVLAAMPLLINDGRELRGRTYRQAQAVYALRVDPKPNRMVQLELTPELHYGTPRPQWTGGDEGVLRLEPARSREVFDRLRMTLRLAPGEMLLLVSLPEAGSRLGHYFHTTDSADGRQQKLILIRPAEVPPSDTFAP